MNKKGFTLIELLAIIIILAIIAVITVPMVLDTVEKSKRNTSIDSAYGYVDSVNKFYYSSSLGNDDYELEDGVYTVSDLKNFGVSISGTEPTDGWCKLVNGNVVSYSLKFGDYVINKYSDSDVVAVKGGDVEENEELEIVFMESTKDLADRYISALESLDLSIVSQIKDVSELNELVVLEAEPNLGWLQFDGNENIIFYSLKFGKYVVNYDSSLSSNKQVATTGGIITPGEIIDGVKYCNASWVKANPVHYNPGHVAVGNTEAIAPGKCTSGNDCKTWYVYSEFTQNGQRYANMIMDRNTTDTVSGWISSSDWETEPSNTGVSYPIGTSFENVNYDTYDGNIEKGPLTVLTQLHDDTDSWNLPLRTDSYTPAVNNYSNFTIDYSGYKARLISAEEVALITRKNTYSNPNAWDISGNYFNFGSLGIALYRCQSAADQQRYGCQNATQKAIQESYSWLFDYTNNCTDNGCTIADSNTVGYWTSSPDIVSNSSTSFAWTIGCSGTLGNSMPKYTTYGVRPVITVPVDDVL